MADRPKPMRSPPRRSAAAPAFPQPVQTFAGRRAELDRILAHVDHDVVFLLYGVAGIGKSELAYQAIRELRALPRWADATPALVDIRPDMTGQRVVAQLFATLGLAPPRRGRSSESAYLSEQLALLARQLDTRPYLLFIDDVQHLDADQVAGGLGYLARHVRASRIVVAARRELPWPQDAPPPVVTTLGPLDPVEAEQMMAALADRSQRPALDRATLMRATYGSPFHIQRILVRDTPAASSLDETRDRLPPGALRLLRAIAVVQHRPAIDADAVETLRELEQQFLITLEDGRVRIHDLVRDAALAGIDREAQATAHEDAATLCLGELDAERPASLLFAVDATNHWLAAGRVVEAWAAVERWHSSLAAAGSEHLLLEPLERLRAALPARGIAIDLLIARCLVRASQFADAARVLARVDGSRSDAEETRFCVLAGEIAQQAGELVRAQALFERAIAHAPDDDARFHARLRMANAAIFGGDGERGRALIDAALAALASPSSRQRARVALGRTASWLVDERFERAVEEARRSRRELSGTDLDLANQLAMLETLGSIEYEELDRARDATRSIDETGLRWRVASLHRSIVRYADGETREASAELVAAHESMSAHGDTHDAYLAGYYGSAALAEIGELGRGLALAERTARLAESAGFRAAAARSLAQQALFAAEAVQSSLGHRLADQALACEHIGCRARARAHCAHARAFTIEGDVTRALEHIALARDAVADAELSAARTAIDLEHAAIDLVGGNLELAVERAEHVVECYRGRSRDYESARAQLILAAAYLARGRRTDLVFAEETIARARAIADRGAMRAIQVGCAILSAALVRRDHRDRAARELLADALRELDPERGSLYAGTLLAAIDGEVAARVAPGAVALLAHLGFREAVGCYLIDEHGRRAATDHDVAREREVREVFVDECRGVISVRRGEVEIRGRAMMCALLSVLVQARGKPVAPDVLYKRVWGAAEYHPLQHRNTLYVAINRLRASLREALPEREVIERAGVGWCLAAGIDACVVVAVRAST